MFDLATFYADCDKVSSQIADYLVYGVRNAMSEDGAFGATIDDYCIRLWQKNPEQKWDRLRYIEVWIGNEFKNLNIYADGLSLIEIPEGDRLRLHDELQDILVEASGNEFIELKKIGSGHDKVHFHKLAEYLSGKNQCCDD